MNNFECTGFIRVLQMNWLGVFGDCLYQKRNLGAFGLMSSELFLFSIVGLTKYEILTDDVRHYFHILLRYCLNRFLYWKCKSKINS